VHPFLPVHVGDETHAGDDQAEDESPHRARAYKIRRPACVILGRVKRAPFAALLAAGAAASLLAAARAPAKEHTAACPELAGMIARVRTGLETAGGQRMRGSSLAAYQVLRATAASMVRDSAGEHCGALGPTLKSSLTRAATARTALDASVELDLGLDAALSLATDGRMPVASTPPKLPPVTEAAVYGQDCPDLFPMTVRLEGPRETLPDRVTTLLADLRAHPRCARVRRLLEESAPERLAHAVDSIRLDEPDEADTSTDPGLMSRCPELPLVVERLGAAISVGAPIFNSGDAAGCRRTYEAAAHTIATEVVAEGRCPAVRTLLAAGLARAQGAGSEREAAWALRHSFDAILGGGPGGTP
jgi:hypothetical protein